MAAVGNNTVSNQLIHVNIGKKFQTEVKVIQE